MKKRKYTLKRRAEKQSATRERIVDAAMDLHETVGPAATTISALAEKAGVQRLTVYRHFPADEDLLAACSTKWLSLHPPPDVSGIRADEPGERTRAILLALYQYFEDTNRMWTSIYRDLENVAALREPMAGFEAYLATVSRDLLSSWTPRRSRRLRSTLVHAVQFSTWKSLASQGLGRRAMADLVGTWVAAAAGCAAERRGAGENGTRRQRGPRTT